MTQRYLRVALMGCLLVWPFADVAPAPAQQRDGQTTESARQERRQLRFRGMDENNDGVITRAEWRGNARAFDRHDTNDDGVLSGNEIWTETGSRAGQNALGSQAGQSALEQSFHAQDDDNDGTLTRREWTSGDFTFRRVDVNGDGVVSLSEFLGEGWDQAVGTTGVVDDVYGQEEDTSRVRRDSRAYTSGYDRGLDDGRQAGREDRQLRNQWDLQGQQELEEADAGYDRSLGLRSDYQAGYRAGFRAGYRQGFGPRDP